MRGVVTGPSSRATMRETLPFAAVERLAMIDLPPFDAKAPHEGLVIKIASEPNSDPAKSNSNVSI